MQLLDWIVLCSTLLLIVTYGTLKTKGAKNSIDYIKGGNEAKWWTVGLSVMATQASAITFLSTPGQAFNDGMGFVQFYFGLPIAIIIICIVFIPIYHKLKVFTAYEYLESRFDLKTRTLTSLLFLIQRSLAAGITIFAPAIILSSVLGWDLTTLNIIIGLLVIIYTVSGGTKAVNYTQKYQMGVIFTGLIITFLIIINSLPDNVTFEKAIELAGANDNPISYAKVDVIKTNGDSAVSYDMTVNPFSIATTINLQLGFESNYSAGSRIEDKIINGETGSKLQQFAQYTNSFGNVHKITANLYSRGKVDNTEADANA